MSDTVAASPPQPTWFGQPKGLTILFLTQMWERHGRPVGFRLRMRGTPARETRATVIVCCAVPCQSAETLMTLPGNTLPTCVIVSQPPTGA
jgi:hypothetical protein